MHGANPAVPIGHCHPHRGGRRTFDLFAMMAPHGRGWPGPGGPGWGGGGWGGPPHRGRRARRGDIRAAALLLLAEEPRNGYQLMQEIEERSGGVWRPSPGSVYPALSQLEDEGLIRSTERDGRKVFELTDEGRAHVEDRRDRLGTPWETMTGGVPDELQALRVAGRALAVAVAQVAQTGTKAQLAEAQKVLEEARRKLYRLLAGDEPEAPEDVRDV